MTNKSDTRVFNGVYFDKEFVSGNRKILEYKQKRAKEMGHNARIIKTFNGAINVYELWVSRKKK